MFWEAQEVTPSTFGPLGYGFSLEALGGSPSSPPPTLPSVLRPGPGQLDPERFQRTTFDTQSPEDCFQSLVKQNGDIRYSLFVRQNEAMLNIK